MIDIIIYKTEKEEMSLEHLYTVEGYATYAINVKSNMFAGGYNFCIPVEKVQQYVKEINSILYNLAGNLHLEDYDSDAYVEYLFVDKSKFEVKGQIGASYTGQMLKFEFEADQTILIGLKRNLLEY